MPTWLLDLRLENITLLTWVYVVAGLFVVAAALPFGVRMRRSSWWITLPMAAIAAAAIGWTTVSVLDVTGVFGVSLSIVVHTAGALVFGGTAVALTGLLRARWWRRVVAIVTVPLVLTAGGLMVNEDFAYFPRLGDVLGQTDVRPFAAPAARRHDVALSHWKPPAGMPATGTLGTAVIPGTESHFHARDAFVYLPPAALVARPPKLPVMIALSGQPGVPSDVFLPGGLLDTMNRIARNHDGVAPIVVSPDQLGGLTTNPMCLDSRLGDVRTYLMDDVRDWILRNLPVSTDRRSWTIAGFSEGGTCAIQLGAQYPAVFGSLIDASGELAPSDGSLAQTIATGFAGDAAAYRRATPIAILHEHRHYPTMRAVFTVGADDLNYAPVMPRVAAAARRAGMRVSTFEIRNDAHDWHAASTGFAYGVGRLLTWWGIET